jgi:hypothetical protein
MNDFSTITRNKAYDGVVGGLHSYGGILTSVTCGSDGNVSGNTPGDCSVD